MIQELGYDFRIALRRLRATPLFTAFAVLSLAFGLGVTTIAYSLVDTMFFRKLAVHEPDRLVFLLAPGNARMRSYSVISRPDFDDLRTSARSFDGLAASQALNLSVASPATTELVHGEAVNGHYFLTLGVPAEVGRTILPADDERASAVAVIGHDLWRGRFASNPAIIGQTVRIGGFPLRSSAWRPGPLEESEPTSSLPRQPRGCGCRSAPARGSFRPPECSHQRLVVARSPWSPASSAS